MNDLVISVPALRRLPQYLHLCKAMRAKGQSVVSCKRISEELNVDPTLIRKDLAAAGITGRPKIGYSIPELISSLASFLGWNNTSDAVLVGAGNLGQALLGYEGFRDYGLNIVAAFDVNQAKIGLEVHGKCILGMEKLADMVGRMHIRIGVLSVPSAVAQQVCDKMVSSGIKAIWNFTPMMLNVPPTLIVENVNLASSLAVLSNKLSSECDV